MELNTVAECDIALHFLDTILGDHRREYNEATDKSREYTEKSNLAWNQLNITHERITEVELRKKELCCTNQTGSKLNSENSSLYQSVGAVVEDYVQAIQSNTNVEVARTMND